MIPIFNGRFRNHYVVFLKSKIKVGVTFNLYKKREDLGVRLWLIMITSYKGPVNNRISGRGIDNYDNNLNLLVMVLI